MKRQFTVRKMTMLPVDMLKKHAGGTRQRWDVLEIGVFEGGAACALFDGILEPGSLYTGIDPWSYASTPKSGTGLEIEARAKANLKPFAESIELIKGESLDVLFGGRLDDEEFDFVHIAGSHLSTSVALDTLATWPLRKTEGIMAWDNYSTRLRRTIWVRPVVDWFLRCVPNHEKLWWDRDCNYGVRKL